jgi:hypothetical protein
VLAGAAGRRAVQFAFRLTKRVDDFQARASAEPVKEDVGAAMALTALPDNAVI